jgi:hypothetical protein
MLKEIGHKNNIPEFIKMVKDKNAGVKLMGFGHRVYKNYDPRATVMRRSCHEVLDELGIKNEPLLKWRWSWNGLRWRMSISSNASCTPMSIFTQALSCGQWASPPACLR